MTRVDCLRITATSIILNPIATGSLIIVPRLVGQTCSSEQWSIVVDPETIFVEKRVSPGNTWYFTFKNAPDSDKTHKLTHATALWTTWTGFRNRVSIILIFCGLIMIVIGLAAMAAEKPGDLDRTPPPFNGLVNGPGGLCVHPPPGEQQPPPNALNEMGPGDTLRVGDKLFAKRADGSRDDSMYLEIRLRSQGCRIVVTEDSSATVLWNQVGILLDKPLECIMKMQHDGNLVIYARYNGALRPALALAASDTIGEVDVTAILLRHGGRLALTGRKFKGTHHHVQTLSIWDKVPPPPPGVTITGNSSNFGFRLGANCTLSVRSNGLDATLYDGVKHPFNKCKLRWNGVDFRVEVVNMNHLVPKVMWSSYSFEGVLMSGIKAVSMDTAGDLVVAYDNRKLTVTDPFFLAPVNPRTG
jgi:hypothetical protein